MAVCFTNCASKHKKSSYLIEYFDFFEDSFLKFNSTNNDLIKHYINNVRANFNCFLRAENEYFSTRQNAIKSGNSIKFANGKRGVIRRLFYSFSYVISFIIIDGHCLCSFFLVSIKHKTVFFIF